jgi:disulfide bond formation protein DsbB
MQNFLTFKKINLFGSLLAFILVGLAVVIQTQFDLEPCPLCVSQRIVFILIGFLFYYFLSLIQAN